LTVRQARSRPLVADLFTWLEAQFGCLPRSSPTAEAICSAKNHRTGSEQFLDDGHIEHLQYGLPQASFEQRRQIVLLLIGRVVVTEADVEIRYVLPTSSDSEHARLCHLREDYFADPAASQFPSASTMATRWRPTTRLAALKPRGPHPDRHLTVCVSMIVSQGLGVRPSARRRSRVRSRIIRSNSPNPAQRRNPNNVLDSPHPPAW
jgi:hypothetical protein